jgi:hypothetical protein
VASSLSWRGPPGAAGRGRGSQAGPPGEWMDSEGPSAGAGATESEAKAQTETPPPAPCRGGSSCPLSRVLQAPCSHRDARSRSLGGLGPAAAASDSESRSRHGGAGGAESESLGLGVGLGVRACHTGRAPAGH